MTTKCLAAVFTGERRGLELRDMDVPIPIGAEILVRVLGCTLCGSDVHTFEGRRAVPVPTILGHEIVGQIAAFGPIASRRDLAGQELDVGDRVTWAIVASCGDCFYCRRGLPQKCQRSVKYGHESFRPRRELTGGLAEYCLLATGTSIVRLPESLPLALACPASCATATVTAAFAAAGDVRDRTICVVGAGMLGLTACAMARSRGASEVVCVDVDPQRRTRSTAFGATRTADPTNQSAEIAEATDSYGVDIAFEVSGSPEAFETTLPQLRLGGTMVLVGAVFPSRPVSLQVEQLVRRNVSLLGIHNYQPEHLGQAVQFLSTQTALPFQSLVAAWLPLREAQQAFEMAVTRGMVRVGVRPT